MDNFKTALVIEDDERWSKNLKDLLCAEGFGVTTALNFVEAQSQLKDRLYDLVTVDLNLSSNSQEPDGMKLLAEIRERWTGEIPTIVIITAFGSKNVMREAFSEFSVADFLDKEDEDSPATLRNLARSIPNRRKPEILIGSQTFGDFSDGSFLYVDKTAWIHKLVTKGKIYFLSRPRRFGKSLLISTLEALFLGRRDLFEGLAIAKTDYDFKAYPVIRLDLSKFANDNAEVLKAELHREFDKYEARWERPKTSHDMPLKARLRALLEGLEKSVFLIDEYDKPILDHMANLEIADQNRELLRELFSPLKSEDEYLKFVFLTGVTRFTKVSIFSDVNNLEDISMAPDYSDIVGFNETEMMEALAPYIDNFAAQTQTDFAQVSSKLRARYNGYRFSIAPTKVYNPWSVLSTFKTHTFKDHWFSTGTPSFLLELIKKDKRFHVKDMRGAGVSDLGLDQYRLNRLDLIPLLFQSGYLTIADVKDDEQGSCYILDYPNNEVERALAQFLLNGLSGAPVSEIRGLLPRLKEALEGEDLEQFFTLVNRDFFTEFPYDLQISMEKYYTSIYHLIFLLIGARARAEEKTNIGRIDEVVEVGDKIYIFEFKYQGSAEVGLAQIQSKQYPQRFIKSGKTIIPVGVNIGKGGVADYKMGASIKE